MDLLEIVFWGDLSLNVSLSLTKARGNVGGGNSQAVNDGPSFSALSLPVVHLRQEAEEGLFGVGDVTIRRPA